MYVVKVIRTTQSGALAIFLSSSYEIAVCVCMCVCVGIEKKQTGDRTEQDRVSIY